MKFSKTEIDNGADYIYRQTISHYSLTYAIRVVTKTLKLLKAEKKRRKNDKDKTM